MRVELTADELVMMAEALRAALTAWADYVNNEGDGK